MSEHLTTHEEYSVICDECDAESTRDGSTAIALKNAEAEGFQLLPDDGVLCVNCFRGEDQREPLDCPICGSPRTRAHSHNLDTVLPHTFHNPQF